MPWTADDAKGHTSRADTPKKKRQWAHIANSALKAGDSEASAIRQANAAVHKMTDTEHSDMTAAVIKYLAANAPDIAALLIKEQPVSSMYEKGKDGFYYLKDKAAKQLTAGDAHVATSLGKRKCPECGAEAGEDHEKDCSMAEKVDWSLPFEVVKADSEQQMVFGWASVATKDGKIIVDKQGDMILPEDLEKAAYDFVLYCRSQGNMHKAMQCGRLVESMMFTKEKQAILGIDLGMEGWWTGFKVDDPELWQAHKRGERPDFSIGGRGRRIDIT